MSTSVLFPYPLFTETDGSPLEAGYVYLGTANLDPETNPVAVYWDSALTIAAAQPIRTTGGYPSRGGSAGQLYTAVDNYSIVVRDKNGALMFSAASISFLWPSTTMGYTLGATGAQSRTVSNRLRERASLLDFGAVGDGATDDSVAMQAALTHAATTGCELHVPQGKTFYHETALTIQLLSDLRLTGHGAILSNVLNGDALTIDSNNYSVAIDGITFNGNSQTAKLLVIEHDSAGEGAISLDRCTFKDAHRSDAGDVVLVHVMGEHRQVSVSGCVFDGANKALSVVGDTAGLWVDFSGTLVPLYTAVTNSTFCNITNSETTGSATNTGADGIRIYGTGATDTDTAYIEQAASITNCHFHNCKGSAVYARNDRTAIANCHVTRSISAITAGSGDIIGHVAALQVKNCSFTYDDSALTEVTNVRNVFSISFYGAFPRGRILTLDVDGVNVFNNLTGATPELYSVIDANRNTGATENRRIFNISNVYGGGTYGSFMILRATAIDTSIANITNCYLTRCNRGFIDISGSSTGLSTLNRINITNSGHLYSVTVEPAVDVGTSNASPSVRCRLSNVIGLLYGPWTTGLFGNAARGASAITGRGSFDVVYTAVADAGSELVSAGLNNESFYCIIIGSEAAKAIARFAWILGSEVYDLGQVGGSGGTLYAFGGTSNPAQAGKINLWVQGTSLAINPRTGNDWTFTLFMFSAGYIV